MNFKEMYRPEVSNKWKWVVLGYVCVVLIIAVLTLLATKTASMGTEEVKTPVIEPQSQIQPIQGTIREVSAYNLGDVYQNDESPCIGATGKDLCKVVESGQKVCAANFVQFGTKLHIKNYGECVVLDRMNSRYKNRVDIAMKLDEHKRALTFGVQNLEVTIK